ncbi:MAG TPA: GAF domain-containing protein [Candidatus Saccharimonadales bacterium]|jgi:L-methionine (R)-S-oxide reductase|nr:GAF domain-containing protein [Candidatus Saccharimonadales bacterium]
MSKPDDALRQVEVLAAIASDVKTLMQSISDHLHSVMPRYNSVSFRLIDEANPRILILGPYTGSFTPQLRIAFDQGLCGTAAATEKAVVVNNVADDSRYLAGTAMVKSEMVVPIFVHGKFVAEIDVQSYFADTFKDPNDRSLVESCASVVEKFMEDS